jgi:hypothetical protein
MKSHSLALLALAIFLGCSVALLSLREDSEKTPEKTQGIQLGPNASLNGKRPFPDDNDWNADISQVPVDPNSDTYIASIGADAHLHPDFGTVYQGAPLGMPYVVVPGNQPRLPVTFAFADESDHCLYPIPPDAPIEGGLSAKHGDRHVLIIDRDNWKLYELYAVRQEDNHWLAGSGAVFDLRSNNLRPAGWTSADAAGLPIFPGLVRYDEVMQQKEIRHALRFSAKKTRRAYIHPARHFASKSTDNQLPPMGLRVRLKASVDISKFPASAQVILQALKNYGMFLADNGGNWFLSGAPDPRWKDEDLATLKRIQGQDLEVIRIGNITGQ